MATLKEQWKVDIPRPRRIPREEWSEEQVKFYNKVHARTPEQEKADGEAFLKWVDELKTNPKAKLRLSIDEEDEENGDQTGE